MPTLTYAAAINLAITEAMEASEDVIVFGEDVAVWGGGFNVTAGLLEKFGAERVLDSPLSENVIVGAGVGAASMGLRPIVELGFADFILTAGDEVFLKAGLWRYMHGGAYTIPLVIRAATGGSGFGPEHSVCPEAYLMHSPGLHCVLPSTPADARALLRQSIDSDNPVVFLEHKMLYATRGEVPEDYKPLPFGKACIRREGDACTIVAWQDMLRRATEAADRLAESGIEVEIIDPVTLNPFDKQTIIESVKKTGRCLVVEEAYKTLGVGAEVGAMLMEEALMYLDKPLVRLAIPDVPLPTAAHMVDYIVPTADAIEAKVRSLVD